MKLTHAVLLLLLAFGQAVATGALAENPPATYSPNSSYVTEGIKQFSSQAIRRFDVSTDGRMLAYVADFGSGSAYANLNDRPRVWLKDLADNRLTQLPGFASTFLGPWPKWSPDGQRLAYIAAQEDKPDAPFAVYVWNRGSGDVKTYPIGDVDRSSFTLMIQWSPDSGMVYVPVRRSDSQPYTYFTEFEPANPRKNLESNFSEWEYTRLLIADPKNKGITQVDSFARATSEPYLAESREAGRLLDLVALDVETGQARTVFTGPSILRVKISPAGDRLMVVNLLSGRWVQYKGQQTGQPFSDLYIVPLDGKSSASRVQPKPGELARDARGKPMAPFAPDLRFFNYFHDESWSPDGKFIAYSEGGPATEGDVMLLDARTGKLRNLTQAIELPVDPRDASYANIPSRRGHFHGKFGTDTNVPVPPVWSRDGGDLYLTRYRPASDWGGMRGELWKVSPLTGEATNLTPNLPFSVAAVLQVDGVAIKPAKNAPGILLAVRFVEDQKSGIVRLDPQSGQYEIVSRFVGKAMRASPYYAAAKDSGYLIFENESSDAPTELYRVDLTGGLPVAVTDVNQVFAKQELPQMRRVSWKREDGQVGSGTLFLPPPSKRLASEGVPPVVLSIYPSDSSWASGLADKFMGRDGLSDTSDIRWHKLWDAGYAVFFPEVRLTKGGKTCSDITSGTLLALDAVAKTELVDANRAGVIGTSFGGYSVNCVVTHTRRFSAAASLAGLGNLIDDDIGRGSQSGGQAALGVSFPDGLDRYIENSPVFHVQSVETPLLLLHGKADGNVVVSQSIQLFQALRRVGKRARIVTYDGEGHGISHPDHFDQILSWFGEFLRGDTKEAVGSGG